MNDYRYLDQKRVKMFLYLSDDVFVPTNWLFYFSTNFTNNHELHTLRVTMAKTF